MSAVMGAVNLITLARPSPDEEALQERLNETLVRELVMTAKGGAAGLLGATVLFWVLVRPWTGGLVSALLVVLATVTVTRLAVAIWLDRGAGRRVPHMRVFAGLAVIYVLSGTSLGAIIVASCPQLPLVTELMLLVVMIGINSTAMVTLGASPLLYLLYVIPGFVGWWIVAVSHPLPGIEHAYQGALALYSITMLATMRSVHRALRNKIVLRLQLGASLGELSDMQSRLLEASRQAGRSDVATAVLHNLGNVLNSVNVSATLANDMIARLKTDGLAKIAALIGEHRDDLCAFLRDDPRGRKLPEYFTQLQGVLERDKTAATAELHALMRNIEHIKIIVASQQSHVKPGGAIETFEIRELLDDALKFSAAACEQHAIEVVRDFGPLPRATLDRHKALQILVNLLANARDAVLGNAGARRIAVHARHGESGSLEITVEDNGCGIEPDNLDRIFRLGFTTKPDGHGLGLHYSACAATELHGKLTARSPGLGLGASFSLVLPLDAA
jgi:signal transduction histidine kinase